jgi:hypothetical protein
MPNPSGRIAELIQAIRTGWGSAGGSGAGPSLWTATTDETAAGGIDCAGNLRIQGAIQFFNATFNAIVGGGTTPNANVLTSTGNANGQIAKARVFDEALFGLTLSATNQIGVVPGRAGTLSQVSVGAVTKPSATGSCTVQVFKNSTANAVTGIFDLNSLTNGVSQTIPITGNASHTATDIFFIQAVAGASLNGMMGAGISLEDLTTDY